jgi:hypothetical protein
VASRDVLVIGLFGTAIALAFVARKATWAPSGTREPSAIPDG